ncbi:hypothetical protein [Apilactobacillus xinyiensis]|uniref:hypothetical protein n=1 Tax=Apilactobacillus xinyiensis TaxID=2841032 RepID=UPI001C7D4081|nr:hypothetical protein [Apilactobacillus xinyiensis]
MKSRKLILTGIATLVLFGTGVSSSFSTLLPVTVNASQKSNKAKVRTATFTFYRAPYTDDNYMYKDTQTIKLRAKEGQTLYLKVPEKKGFNSAMGNKKLRFKLINGKFKQLIHSSDKTQPKLKEIATYDNTPGLKMYKKNTDLKSNIKGVKPSRIKEEKVKVLDSNKAHPKVYSTHYYSSIANLPND